MVTEVDLFSKSECVREGATLRETGDGNCSSSEESTTSRRFLGSGRTGIAGWEGKDEGLIYIEDHKKTRSDVTGLALGVPRETHIKPNWTE